MGHEKLPGKNGSKIQARVGVYVPLCSCKWDRQHQVFGVLWLTFRSLPVRLIAVLVLSPARRGVLQGTEALNYPIPERQPARLLGTALEPPSA